MKHVDERRREPVDFHSSLAAKVFMEKKSE